MNKTMMVNSLVFSPVGMVLGMLIVGAIFQAFGLKEIIGKGVKKLFKKELTVKNYYLGCAIIGLVLGIIAIF